MKSRVKHGLSRVGLFNFLDGMRRLPRTVHYLRSGCSGPAPAPIKRQIIKAYQEFHQLWGFVETGTHLGDTLAFIARDNRIRCCSIELDGELYRNAKDRFGNYSNVRVFHGDSGEVLPAIIEELSSPTLFWLDGHYSGGVTAKGESDTPVSKELRTILDSSVKDHVILIDDARCFDGTNGYPFLDQLLAVVRRQAEYEVEVSADIIRLTPRKKR